MSKHDTQYAPTEGAVNSKKRPLILVTNDDGIASPGLLVAARCVLDLGDVWVVAPHAQQSGRGRSFPNHQIDVTEGSLEIDGVHVPSFSAKASPAQAVRHGILRFLPRLPDLAISGINYGENLGGCITISGTIGAAIESATFGIPSLAASVETAPEYHYSHSADVAFGPAAAFVRWLASHLLLHGMPEGVDVLKLDVPCDAKPNTPWRTTRVSRQQYFVSPVTVDEQGLRHVSGYAKDIDLDTLEPDSDIHALAVDRVVSISPLTIDLTAIVGLQDLRNVLSISDPAPRSGCTKRD